MGVSKITVMPDLIYRSIAELQNDITSRPPSVRGPASAQRHYVETAHYRFRVELDLHKPSYALTVKEVPFWQMTVRQLCDAILRRLCCCLALRKSVLARAQARVSQACSVAALCRAWRPILSRLDGNPAAAPAVAGLPDWPSDFREMEVPAEWLQSVRDMISALATSPRRHELHWDEIEPVLTLLYSIGADVNNDAVRKYRDEAFNTLLKTASTHPGFFPDIAIRLLLAMDALPAQPPLRDEVVARAKALLLERIHKMQAACWPPRVAADPADLKPASPSFDEAKNLFRLALAVVRALPAPAEGTKVAGNTAPKVDPNGGQMGSLLPTLAYIAQAPAWSHGERQDFERMLRDIRLHSKGEKPKGTAPRRWGRPSSTSVGGSAHNKV